MLNREEVIRRLCELQRVDELADVIVASVMTTDDVRRLMTHIGALRDEATDSAPSMPPRVGELAVWVPAQVFEKVRELIAIHVGESRMPPRRLQ